MTCTRVGIAALGVAAVALLGLLELAAAEGSKRVVKTEAQKGRKSDDAAVREALKAFVRSFEKGDAKALAASWAEGGQYHGDDGTVLEGRDAIEKAYEGRFAVSKANTGEVEVEAVHFTSRDSASVEGSFTIRHGKEAPQSSHFNLQLVREDGNWLMTVLRETPGEAVSLNDLNWLIGTWEVKRFGTEVSTTYQWVPNKAFIRVAFSIKDKDRELSGFQIIGVNRATGQLRSWTFEHDGGFGEADWTRDGEKWVLDATGTSATGAALTATNLFTRLDDNSFTWQSTDRTSDGAKLPDLPPVKVSRVKSK